MPSRVSETRHLTAGLVAIVFLLVSCVPAGEATSASTTHVQALEETDRRITELEAEVAALQREIQVLETRGDVYSNAFDRNVELLQVEMGELREQARHWISIADEFGESAEGPGYWWAQAPVRGCATTVWRSNNLPVRR